MDYTIVSIFIIIDKRKLLTFSFDISVHSHSSCNINCKDKYTEDIREEPTSSDKHTINSKKDNATWTIKEKKIIERLLCIDAAYGTNYYERYLQRRHRLKPKRSAMGDSRRYEKYVCCVVL